MRKTKMDLFNKKTAIVSLLLGVLYTLLLSYDIAGTYETLNDRVVYGLSSYGFDKCIISVGVGILIYFIRMCLGKYRVRDNKGVILIAAIFGLLNTSGVYMYYQDALPRTFLGILLFAVYTVAFAFAFCLAWKVFSYTVPQIRALQVCGRGGDATVLQRILEVWNRHAFAISFCIIMLCWLPWIISFYPASMEWDVYYPIQQFVGDATPTNHHPWFYAVVVGSAYRLGELMGNKNIGVFIYIIIRNFAIAGIFSRCICMLKKYGIRDLVLFIVLAFYSVTPVWGAYAKHAFKDIAAAAFFCWFITATVCLVIDINESGRISVKTCIEFSVAALLASLFRNNCIYVALPVAAALIVIFVFKKVAFRMILIMMSGIVLYFGWQYYILNVLDIEPTTAKEALAIPIQQVARTVRYNFDEITDEQKEILSECWDLEQLKECYDPILSDPVKDSANPVNKAGLMKVWLEFLHEYPLTYVEAAVAQSSGYYAFTPDYPEGAGNSNAGMTIFNWVEDGRFSADFVCHYSSSEFLGKVRDVLAVWAKIWHKIPILNFTDMKALYTWTVVLIGYWIFHKRKNLIYLVPVLGVLLMAGTAMASPVNDCFRYFCPVAAAFPALFALLAKNKTSANISGSIKSI